jgi:uncharacterized membrane protein YhaH (DUF805 family)
MNIQEAVKTVFHNYATISGRAARSQYWFWALFVFLVTVALGVVDGAIFGTTVTADGMTKTNSVLGTIFTLGTLVPYICVAVRRMHDVDKSGWWLLINLIPVIGWILFIVWAATKGTTGDNRFGPDPLASQIGG